MTILPVHQVEGAHISLCWTVNNALVWRVPVPRAEHSSGSTGRAGWHRLPSLCALASLTGASGQGLCWCPGPGAHSATASALTRQGHPASPLGCLQLAVSSAQELAGTTLWSLNASGFLSTGTYPVLYLSLKGKNTFLISQASSTLET